MIAKGLVLRVVAVLVLRVVAVLVLPVVAVSRGWFPCCAGTSPLLCGDERRAGAMKKGSQSL